METGKKKWMAAMETPCANAHPRLRSQKNLIQPDAGFSLDIYPHNLHIPQRGISPDLTNHANLHTLPSPVHHFFKMPNFSRRQNQNHFSPRNCWMILRNCCPCCQTMF
jgi:hypothetical protein